MVSSINTKNVFSQLYAISCLFIKVHQMVFLFFNGDELAAKYYSIIALKIRYRNDITKYQGPTKWVRPTILNSSHASAIFMKRISFDLKFYSLWLSLLPHIIVMKEKQCTGRRGENNSSCKCLQYKNMYINGCLLSMWNNVICC